MSFIDKIKSKLKSTSADELIASLTGIKKQSKEFAADAATLGKAAQTALTEHGVQLSLMQSGGAAGFEKTRRAYELAVGQLDRMASDYRSFSGTYAGFILSMTDVQEALGKLAKKEKDAKVEKEITAAVRELTVLISDASKKIDSALAPSLEKVVKGSKDNIRDCEKRFNAAISKVESLLETAIDDCKSALKYFKEAQKLAPEVGKACEKNDIKKSLVVLKALNERKAKHDNYVQTHATHRKTFAALGESTDFSGDVTKVAIPVPARLMKEFEAASLGLAKDNQALAGLIDGAIKEIRVLKTSLGLA